MRLADKLRYLREVEGTLRGLGRAITQGELLRAIAEETDSKLSQSYLSQIESGRRPHLTNTSRLLLARFFKVHPGYLVEDPEGYSAELLSPLRTSEDRLDLWLIAGSDRFHKDAALCRALRTVARQADSRGCLLLLELVLEAPELAERLAQVLRPGGGAGLGEGPGAAGDGSGGAAEEGSGKQAAGGDAGLPAGRPGVERARRTRATAAKRPGRQM